MWGSACQPVHDGSEISFDTGVVTDAKLDVVLVLKSGVVIKFIALWEHGAHGLVARQASLGYKFVQTVDDEAIECSRGFVFSYSVPWQRDAHRRVTRGKCCMGVLDQLQAAAVEQVQAMFQVDDGAQHERRGDRTSNSAFPCPLERALRIAFPEIESMP